MDAGTDAALTTDGSEIEQDAADDGAPPGDAEGVDSGCDGEGACPCPPGHESNSTTCVDIDECAIDHGGCDELVNCTNSTGSHSCSACPTGFTGSGAARCRPTLTQLEIEGGRLEPAFDPEHTIYDVRVNALRETVTVRAAGPTGSAVGIEGVAVAPGDAWISPALALGTTEIEANVAMPLRESRSYGLTLRRGDVDFLKASNARASDRFGGRIAIDRDTIAVGVIDERSPAPGGSGEEIESGAVYVFERRDGAWIETALLNASHAESGDWFGWSVAIDGDTMVVGANHEDSAARGVDDELPDSTDNGADNSGAAYVFEREGDGWAQRAFLKASNAEASDWFGGAVAIAGDTIVVGAGGDDSAAVDATSILPNIGDNGAEDSGAAYVFVRSARGWSSRRS